MKNSAASNHVWPVLSFASPAEARKRKRSHSATETITNPSTAAVFVSSQFGSVRELLLFTNGKAKYCFHGLAVGILCLAICGDLLIHPKSLAQVNAPSHGRFSASPTAAFAPSLF